MASVAAAEALVARLLLECRAGNENALVRLLDLTYDPARRIADCVTGRPGPLTDDVLHAAYVEVWRRCRNGHDFGARPAHTLLGIVHAQAVSTMTTATTAA